MRVRFSAVLVCLLSSLFSGPIRSDYQSGLDAYQQGDYQRAYTQWLAVAQSPSDQVHPGIQAETYYALGMLFWIGQGVRQDTSESAGWMERAAQLHHAGAQTKLGYLYSSGQGVRQSDFEAFKWFQMAANQGDPDAQYNLGVLYRDGLGVAVNQELALQWFREAAANGDAVSASVVAEMEREQPPESESVSSSVSAESQPLVGEFSESMNQDTTNVLGEDWILERDPGHYTIQVIALLKASKLHEFAQRNPDWAPFAIYQQSFQGDPLWVLVQGDYPDVTQARAAVLTFPTDIQQRDKLWIRRFVMVQDLLP